MSKSGLVEEVAETGLLRSRFARAEGRTRLPAITPVFMGIGLVEVRRPYAYPRHQHTNYEVIYVDQGTYTCRHNDLEVTLGPNHVLIAKPGDWHEDHFDGRHVRYLGVSFAMEASGGVDPALFREGTPTARQHFKASRAVFMPIIRRIMDESRKGDFMSAPIQDALVLEFFCRIIRALPRGVLADRFVATSREASFASRLLSLLGRRATRNPRVAEMAEAMGMSTSSLAHRCRAVLGMPPAKVLFHLRMDRAVAMLKATEMSVKQVSAYLGFGNQFHFSNAFKKRFGVPPSNLKGGRPRP